MRVVVDNKNIAFKWVSVTLSLGTIARSFTLLIADSTSSIMMGDRIQISTDSGRLLIDAVIEYISCDSNQSYTYAGRNKSRMIVDSFAEKTVQYSEIQDIVTVLDTSRKFGVSIRGNARLPKDERRTILAGTNLGIEFANIAYAASSVIHSDASGDINIEGEPKYSDQQFMLGDNIRARTFVFNQTLQYDRYIVKCQSNLLLNDSLNADISGEFGSGERVKVVVSDSNLNAQECTTLAQHLYNLDRRSSLQYEIEIDTAISVDLNHLYSVDDAPLGISRIMRANKIVVSSGIDYDKTLLTLGNIDD